MNKGFLRSVIRSLMVVAVILLVLQILNPESSLDKMEIDFTDLIENIQNNNISRIWMRGNNAKGEFKKEFKQTKEFNVYIPNEARQEFYNNYLKDLVDNQEIGFGGESEEGDSIFVTLLPTFLTLFMIIGLFWFISRQQAAGGQAGKMQDFGKSKATLNKEDPDNLITFEEVAGLEEEKEELKEIVDFLKGPKKYLELGARIPTGVLLVGPPGTGKTYLSRAVAGESKVPFYTISGSNFVEMFVGVGASRVRDLFEEAKKNAPCIIFIDEIDAVGRRRGAGMGGGHDEREQTLNQLLVEMDGFAKNEGIIVMAATNRPDILDPALLRPGRFDRTIQVGLPDVRGREEILEVHTKNKPLSEDVDLNIVARRTPGFSPADLENLVNEAALLTARQSGQKIKMETIEEASIKVQAGPAKKSRVISEKARKITAYHEAGHALAARLLEDYDEVHMVTIIPRGQAGGFTSYIPDEDIMYMLKGELEDRLIVLLAGRASEEIVLGDISTGAQNDIERATDIARQMITHYGMNDKLGPMTYGDDNGEVFMGKDFGRSSNYSEKVAATIDIEMRKLIDTAYDEAKRLLTENIDILHSLSQELLERETLDRHEFEEVYKRALEKRDNK